MIIEKRRVRLVRSKKSINQKVSQSKRVKKMNKSKKKIVPRRKKINLKIKLKIELLVRKNLRNDIIASQYFQCFEKYIIIYHFHSSYFGGVRFSLGFATKAVIYSPFP